MFPTATSLVSFLFSLFLLSSSIHVVRADTGLPEVAFDRMGKVGIAGSFAGLDVFDSAAVAYDPESSSLLSRSPDGSLSHLASTNAGGVILAGCAIGDTTYFAGSFSSLGGTSAANLASYTSGKFDALGSNGPNGEVNALYCDEKNSKVWAGGRFTSPGKAVAVYDTKAKSWSQPPFGGLAGADAEVLSITVNSSASSLFFAGSFITSFVGNNSVELNSTNNPHVPHSAGATPFSSSLVPLPLSGTSVVGEPSSDDSKFQDVNSILCPAGDDGPGNTWFAANGNTARITARAFRFLSASGVRLGNTFLNGRGTTGFSIATIPDNKVQTLKYVDPATNETKTCSDKCPLGTDSSVLYQDFLFDESMNITGVEVTLSEWKGDGPGLHIFQVLSSGAFVSAVDDQNGKSCYATQPSNTTHTDTWSGKVANAGIPGTQQSVLVSTVKVGTDAGAGPSFTWMPYVSASGIYDMFMLVPGCDDLQDCAVRTSVKVVVFPGGGQQPWVTTVSQTGHQDKTALIYSGPVVPTSPDFVATVQMTLADQPEGKGQNGNYELVADRIQLVLKSANVTDTGAGQSNGNGTGSSVPATVKNGFGFLEWPITGGDSVDATSTIPNKTETALDLLSFAMFTGLGGNSSLKASASPAIAAVVHHSSGAIFIGGNFTIATGDAAGASYIAKFQNGKLSTLPEQGVDGPVTSLALEGDRLFVGGSFSKSSGGGVQSKGVILYDVAQNKWAALEGGVDGGVSSLVISNERVQIAGNFSHLLGSDGASANAGGFASWSITNNTWAPSGGFLIGSMSFVSEASDKNDDTQFIAGAVTASLKFGASGFVMLSNGGDNGVPNVTPLGVQLESVANASSAKPAAQRRHRRAHTTIRAWLNKMELPRLSRRQSNAEQNQLPNATGVAGPSVFAGAFWTDSSQDEVTIIGGNFSFTASGSSTKARNIAFYDATKGSVTALQGAQPSGVVRALLVQGNMLYVGGNFTLEGTDVNGFAVYDLANQKWATDGIEPLKMASGGSVEIRSVTASPAKTNTVIVAGTLSGSGSLTCNGICLLDTNSKKWTAAGSGINGQVVSVVFGGSKQDALIAYGALALADNTPANVLKYAFANNTWTAVGSNLPGPVSALEVNNGNLNSIFAAGKSSNGGSNFFSVWNGNAWNDLSNALQDGSNVSALTMVPLSKDHSAQGVIEKDRMLLISGSLSIGAGSNGRKRADATMVSSALFDGQSFFPYLTTASPSGGSGSISGLIHSFPVVNFDRRKFLAVGIVILISIAIAAGIVFLIVLIGILWTLFARKDDHRERFDPAEVDDDSSANHHRPTSLLAHINAATRNTIIGGPSPYSNYNSEKEHEMAAVGAGAAAGAGPSSHGHTTHEYDEYDRAETPSEAMGMAMGGDDDDEDGGRVARARYSFDGAEEGELRMEHGAEVLILDDRDPAWWYARDPNSGREGVVPSNYVY